ncbi:hypothetical protein [Limnobaculum xujianqingii]|uniref:hypothetical protein n=1 Tax=Limnobaculum xujianqingii TaxID=2738837 RepID=UPI0015BFAB51|nr:hypothetical protein [Limnobaculum xujianqingii]
MTAIFQLLGVTVCVLGGIALTTLLLALTCDYTWRKIRAAHDLNFLRKAVKAAKRQGVS